MVNIYWKIDYYINKEPSLGKIILGYILLGILGILVLGMFLLLLFYIIFGIYNLFKFIKDSIKKYIKKEDYYQMIHLKL